MAFGTSELRNPAGLQAAEWSDFATRDAYATTTATSLNLWCIEGARAFPSRRPITALDRELGTPRENQMSTIPLSAREGHGQTLSGGDLSTTAVHAENDNELDALIEKMSDTVVNRGIQDEAFDRVLLDSPSSGEEADGDSWRAFKSSLDDPEKVAERGRDTELDRALTAAVGRRADQEAESADFRQSREWRDALKERYGGQVAIGDLLEIFADWHERLKDNPGRTAEAMASAYLVQPSYALPNGAQVAKKLAPAVVANGSGVASTLDDLLAAAIGRHHGKGDGEQQAFAASARHRQALKEMFPGLSYAEACRRVVRLDGDLHRDPIGTAARLAATYGMTATPAQQIVAEERGVLAGDAQQVVATAAERLPDLADLEDDVIAVMQRPEFRHGPDMQENLMRAHRVAQLAHGEQTRRRERSAATRSAPAGLDGLIAQAIRGAGAA